MSLFRRKTEAGQPSSGPSLIGLDEDLSDSEWWAACDRAYESQWRDYAGSPESFAQAGEFCYGHQDFGQALLFYRKAIDLLHTQYVVMGMQNRQPSAADAWIVDGVCSAAGASHALKPEAPLDESIREVTHRLRTICTTSNRVGINDSLYRNALSTLAANNSNVRVDDILW